MKTKDIDIKGFKEFADEELPKVPSVKEEIIEEETLNENIPTEWNFLNELNIVTEELELISEDVIKFHKSLSKNFIEIEQVTEATSGAVTTTPASGAVTKEYVDLIALAASRISEEAPRDIEEEQELNVGVLSERIEQLQKSLVKVNSIMRTPGSGEVRLEFLDDIDRTSTKVDGKYLKYQASTNSWIGADGGGGGGGAGNPVISGTVTGNNLVLTLQDNSTVTINVAALKNSEGNPVTSGTVTGNNLVLTLEDSSTVTVDVTTLKNIDSNTYITAPNWYQTYANPGSGNAAEGAQVGSLTPTYTNGPWNYGRTLARGEEVLFDQTSSGQVRWIGVWGGGATYNTSEAGSASYWTKHIRFKSNMVSSSGTTRTITKGFDQVGDYNVTQSITKFALVYDYTSMKLMLYERHTGEAAEQRTLITTASVAEDGNPITLSCAYEASGTDLPDFIHREHTWHIIAELNDGADLSWQDGTQTGTVMRHGTGLHVGEKMVITTPGSWKQHYFGFDYTGTALGQSNVHVNTTTSFRCNANEKMAEHIGWTINNRATRYGGGGGTETDVMDGAKISIRYHLDNSVDIFDEDNEDILFFKDDDMDGSVLYLHTFFNTAVNATNASVWLRNWQFEPFAAAWYEHPANKYEPNIRYSGSTLDGAGRKIRGEKMYPGQEVHWNYNHVNTGYHTYIGVRDVDDNTWLNNKAIKMGGTNFLLAESTGWDSTTNYAAENKIFALRYDAIDFKLKLYDVTVVGVETLVTSALAAEDGNAINLSISGNGTKTSIGSVRYYGWEYAHLPHEHSQPWKNWRLTRPAANVSIKQNTVVRHRRALIPGKAMRWVTPNSGTSKYYGVWLTTNPNYGHINVDSHLLYWDWGFRMNTSEEVLELDQMTFNTSNPNYTASPQATWDDPDKGVTNIQIRYNADNSIDLHDATNNQIIATKDVDGDGSPIYISVGMGTNETNIADNFMGGGDVQFVSL